MQSRSSTGDSAFSDTAAAQYLRALPVTRVILVFISIACWLILISHALNFTALQTTNWMPVLGATVVSTGTALLLFWLDDSQVNQRYLQIGLLIPLLYTWILIQNGYLPVTFAPITIVLTQCVYRARGSKLLPYLIWLAWCLALYLSPVQEGQAFTLRLMLVTLAFIPITDLLLRQVDWSHHTKIDLLKLFLGLILIAVFVIGISQVIAGSWTISTLVSLVTISVGYGLIAKSKTLNHSARVAIAALVLGAYWFAVIQNGVLPTTLVGALVLLSFLLLPAYEALFFSLALVTLSLLPLISLDASQLDFEPAPFFARHFAVTLLLIFAFYQLFRTREREMGYRLQAIPVAQGMLIATGAVILIAIIGDIPLSSVLENGAEPRTLKWLVNGGLIWLFSAWISSAYLSNQRALKQTNVELETASRRIAMAAENARCGFWTFEYGAKQISWDEQVHAIWELEPNSLSPEELFTFWSNSLDPKDLQWILNNEARLIREGAPGDMGQHRFEITTAKGNKRWVEATFTLLVEEGRSLLIGMNRDMTEDQELREQLLLAADKAVELAEAKSHFLANMSHEIRTPLNAVLGLAQQLTRRNRYPSEVVSHANRIVKAGQSLLSLLNDILDFSKLDSGKLQLNFASVDLFDMLDNLATLMTNSARNKQLELVIHSPEGLNAKVEADQLRLEQILINLVGNAIKFTDQGFVALDVEVLEQQESNVVLRFCVKDSGTGISRVDLQKLTAPFVQADASITRRFGGTGLGLSICKRLLAVYGTELEIQSEPGQGSEFAFTLRLRLASNERLNPSTASAVSLLFADDQPIAREALLASAKALGWDGQAFSSGAALLEQYGVALRAGQQIDLVLLDWKMPELDGAETAKRVKELAIEHGMAEPPTVVMVTGYSMEHIEDVPQVQYIDRILEKPVTPTGLKNTYLALTVGLADESVIESDAPLEGLRLLVVDDNLYNREVAKVILESEGAQVEMVEDGQLAVDWVLKNANEVSAVLMDVQMPIMDGLKATRVLRANPQSAGIPILGMSAGAFEDDIQAALDAGMDDYLTKPIDVHLVVEKLVHLLKSERAAGSEVAQSKRIDKPHRDDQALFDQQMALSIWQDQDKLARMLESFVTEFSPKLEAERLMLEALDAQELHKMKGAAGAMFLQRLQSCLQTLEQPLLAAELRAEDISTLSEVWQATLTKIGTYLEQHPIGAQGTLTHNAHEIPDAELQALLNAFYTFDPDEVRPQINALKGEYPCALLEQTQALIDGLDFNAAAKLIEQELESRPSE